jgi:hypothetical protein
MSAQHAKVRTVPQRPVSRAISYTWQLDYDTWERGGESQRCQCGAYTGRVVWCPYLLFLYWRSPSEASVPSLKGS